MPLNRSLAASHPQSWRRLAVILSSAISIVLSANIFAFYVGLYRYAVDPGSSTGAFERAITNLKAWRSDRKRDVLVLGDSRIYAGLNPSAAGAASGGLRFLNGGIPGTTPRSWYFFDRAIDEHADRFRAVVIPVDSYSDDTGAIGSLDAVDHALDLRYIVFQTMLGDIIPLAASFNRADIERDVAFDLALRGPILRHDFQALLSDPAARASSLERHTRGNFAAQGQHPFGQTLSGLSVDFRRNLIERYPPWVTPDEKVEMAKQVLRVAQPSASYATYRERWLGPIVRRYRAAMTPVIFVRIPTRPVHRSVPPPPHGSLTLMSVPGAVSLLPQRDYVAMERPDLFADHDHLNAKGSRRFSIRLGKDVARAIAIRSSKATAQLGSMPLSRGADFLRLLAPGSIGFPISFQSWDFVFFFISVAAIFYAVPRRYGRNVLLAASYYFYLRWNAWYVVLLMLLTMSDFVIALWLGRGTSGSRKLLLGLGIGANLAFLGTFKYLNFATSTLAALLRIPGDPWLVNLIVPVGISFHTFQSISYLVDVARGRTKAITNVFDYALYIAFFPQLLAGPIVRAARFFDELLHFRTPSVDDVERGLREVLLGLVKKLVIADQFAQVSDAYFGAVAQHPGAPAAWSGVFAFAIQIYFDFSGYSDIAIGCARLLGFAFPENFRRPYFAVSISDFWRRWNISLSTWLRDYLYISLGGNRGGTIATRRNLLVTMLLAGLWHGASWTFVAWGGYHGLLLVAERALGLERNNSLRAWVKIGRTGLTFVLVLFGWVLFRAGSFDEAFHVMTAMLAGGPGSSLLVPWTFIPLTVALLIGVGQEYGARWDWKKRSALMQAGGLAGMLLAIEMCSWPGPAEPFVYFRF